MIAFAEYLLKVIICSALLSGYYWFALRNKLFHAWNRFYILASVIIAIGLPFLKITFLQEEQQQVKPAYQVLQTITTDEVWFEETTDTLTPKQSFVTAENVSIGLYLVVSFITLMILLIAIFRIIRLIKKYQHWKINNLVFVDTDARGTPFSFLHFVFWNRDIDFNSEQGQQIFAHELVHVQQKHSWDKLFINTVLIVFWSNPFFWLIRKELTMIHEFIADQQSVKDHDSASFSAMILATAFPRYNMPLTNPFFYSPIKRRLLMLTKLQNPKVGYISRLLLLPLGTLMFFVFAVKPKKAEVENVFSKIHSFEQPLTYYDTFPTLKGGALILTKEDCLLLADSSIIIRNADYQKSMPIIVLNGKIKSAKELSGKTFMSRLVEQYPANDEKTIKKYGPVAKGGAQVFYNVKEIERPAYLKQNRQDKYNSEQVFTKAEVMPVFPGGEKAWDKYIQAELLKNKEQFTATRTCEIEFIVRKDGSVTDAKINNQNFTRAGQICLNALMNGPKWIPAIQNSRIVSAKTKVIIKLRY